MVRKCLTYLLTLSLLTCPLFAQTKAEKKAAQEAARVENLKTTMRAIGLGDTAPAELRLKRGGKWIGYVSEMKDGTMVFAETKAATTHEFSYTEIHSIKAYDPKDRRQWKWYVLTGVILAAVTVLVIKECQRAKRRGETCAPDETNY